MLALFRFLDLGEAARKKIVHSLERILGTTRLWLAEAATPPPT